MSQKALVPRKTAVQARSKFTVETIYEAAVQVFTERGYAGATTDLIAERAGVSIGTLYQYFPNKKAILIGIWDRSMDDADKGRDSLANRCKQGGRAVDAAMLGQIVAALLQMHKQSIKVHLFFEEVPQPAFIRKRFSEKEVTTLRLFEQMLECAANSRRPDSTVTARIVYEVIDALIHRYLTHFRAEMSEDTWIREMCDLLGRYLFAEESQSAPAGRRQRRRPPTGKAHSRLLREGRRSEAASR